MPTAGETFVYCERCTATIRGPARPHPCSVCGYPLLSREQANEPNHLLYVNWQAVLRRIPGFSRCVCLRRVPCPTARAMDMDFLLLEPPPGAKLGLVETEGWNSAADAPMKVPKGADQVDRYLREFRAHAGRGRELRRECIDPCFNPHAQRGLINTHRWGSLRRWMTALPGVKTREGLERILAAASRDLVPILLYFVKPSDRPPFSAADEDALRRALQHRPAYVGTVAWPSADALLSGYFLDSAPAGSSVTTRLPS